MRTDIDIDDDLMDQAMRSSGAQTKSLSESGNECEAVTRHALRGARHMVITSHSTAGGPDVILIDQGRRRFNYRVAGVAIRDDAVLLHRATGDAFWTLPGGRAEVGEPAHDTLRREMREELDADVRVDRLLWIVENFFDYQDRRHHELALYFLMHFPAQSAAVTDRSFERTLSGVPMVFEWFPIRRDALDQITIFPTFLRRALTSLPPSVEHVVEGR